MLRSRSPFRGHYTITIRAYNPRQIRATTVARQLNIAGGHRRCECTDDMSAWAHSPPLEEGWLRGQLKVAKPPYSAETGWSLTSRVSKRIPAPSLEAARYRACASRKGG